MAKSTPAEPEPEGGTGIRTIVVRASTLVLDAGSEVDLEVFLTGTGRIASPRLVLYPSRQLVDPRRSWAKSGFEVRDGKIYFGGAQTGFDENGFTLSLTASVPDEALPAEVRGGRISYVDPFPWNPRQLTTERKMGQAPVHVHLGIPEDCLPGSYPLRMVLSYFNGEAWASSEAEVILQVRYFFQRWEKATWWIVILATALGGLAAVADVLSTWFRFPSSE